MGAAPGKQSFNVIATKNYRSIEHKGHLHIKEGMTYEVTKTNNLESLYFGHLAGISDSKEGWFPQSCVKKELKPQPKPILSPISDILPSFIPELSNDLIECRTCGGSGNVHRTTGGCPPRRRDWTESCGICKGISLVLC
jgi:hypothetical protein